MSMTTAMLNLRLRWSRLGRMVGPALVGGWGCVGSSEPFPGSRPPPTLSLAPRIDSKHRLSIVHVKELHAQG